MNKDEILEYLRVAKAAHVSWVQRAKMLIEGFTINETSIPINATECQFGKWFYSDGQRLNDMRNIPLESMQEIEEIHFQLHDIYMKIYKIYYDVEKKGFFSKLFVKKKQVSEEEMNLSKTYYDEMNKVSKKLVTALNLMERRINVVNSKEIESI